MFEASCSDLSFLKIKGLTLIVSKRYESAQRRVRPGVGNFADARKRKAVGAIVDVIRRQSKQLLSFRLNQAQ